MSMIKWRSQEFIHYEMKYTQYIPRIIRALHSSSVSCLKPFKTEFGQTSFKTLIWRLVSCYGWSQLNLPIWLLFEKLYVTIQTK